MLRTLARTRCPCSPPPLPRPSSSSFSFSRFRSTTTVPASPLPPPASKYTLPKGLELKGTVVQTGKMQHTCTVSVERRMTDHKTLKEFSKHTKYLVHDPEATCVIGDQVKIRNCRPVSARKRFELVQVVKGARERLLQSSPAPHPGPEQASPISPPAA